MFTQKEKLNILRCDGCDERCKFGAYINYSSQTYIPTINGKEIKFYINKNGFSSMPSCKTASEAYDAVREIAKVCDNYKTR